MKKVTIKKKDREMTFHERLVASKAIDLTNNHEIIDLGNSYCKIIPIDKNKLIK